MKNPLLVAVAALTVAAAAMLPLSAAAHGKDTHAPQHGGIVAETKEMDLELVAKPELISLHARAGDKKVDLAQASAKLSLLSNAGKTEVLLSPAGDRLEAKGPFTLPSGTKAVLVLTLPGKPVATARYVLK